MKHIVLSLLWLVCTSHSVYSQSPVYNESVYIDDIRKEATFNYALEAQNEVDKFFIFLRVTIDGETFRPEMIRGDAGLVEIGEGKKIIWDLSDYTKIPEKIAFTILASSRPEPNPTNVKIGIGTMVVGLGTAALGIIRISQAKKDYDENYSRVLDPFNDFYSKELNTTRSQYYEDLNQQHKRGSVFLIAGGVIALASSAVLTRELIKKIKLNDGLSVVPYYELNIENKMLYASTNELGLHLKYTF